MNLNHCQTITYLDSSKVRSDYTAERDLVIKNAAPPVFENVTRDIRKGVAPVRTDYVE